MYCVHCKEQLKSQVPICFSGDLGSEMKQNFAALFPTQNSFLLIPCLPLAGGVRKGRQPRVPSQ